jgi:hypothetical protein
LFSILLFLIILPKRRLTMSIHRVHPESKVHRNNRSDFSSSSFPSSATNVDSVAMQYMQDMHAPYGSINTRPRDLTITNETASAILLMGYLVIILLWVNSLFSAKKSAIHWG